MKADLIDWLARLWSCPERVDDHGRAISLRPRVDYQASFLGLIDLVAALPVLYILLGEPSQVWFDLVAVFSLFKFSRYVPALELVGSVVRNERRPLMAALSTLALLLTINATCMFLVERAAQPEIFKSIPHTLWWGIVTMTTTGYGDIHPGTPQTQMLCALIAIGGTTYQVLVMGLLGFALTLLMVSRDLKLGLITVGGFALALLLFAGLAALALWALRRMLPGEQAPRWLRLATRQVTARPWFAVVQVSSLSVGLLALALLVLLRTDLVASWRQATPKDAPDRFVINVQPDQAQAFLAHLQQAGVRAPDWYPMVRGRLVAVNGREVRPSDYPGERARRLVDREFNLSYTDHLPAHNPLLAGHWTPGEKDGVSVEQGIADTLGLKLGDRLRFDMGGVVHEARITSLRKVDWASMRANFFMLFPLAQMPDLPTTWLAAFRTPEGDRQFERVLVQKFPNVTSVDMRASLMQVQRVLDQVIQAVEFLFAFTLAAGVMVLLAAIGSGRQAREREYAIMRALGAGRALLAQVQRTELLGVGFLAGFMASVMALVVGWALARYAFDFSWAPVWWTPLAGGLVGGLLAWMAGSLSLAGVLRQPVVQTLRQAAE